MESKFKKGDRVLCADNGKYGNVTLVDTSQVGEYGSNWYEVLFDDGEEAYLEEEYLELTDVDKKTAFLTELKELMERYDAYITDGKDISGKNLIHFGFSNEDITYTTDENGLLVITPSNIFDYSKGES